MLIYLYFFIQLLLQDVWGQMRATRQSLPTSGLALAELEVGLHGQELEGPVVARSKGVSTSQGWDRHENKMAKLREQRQTFRKVLQTSDRKFFGFGIGFGRNFGFNTHFGFGIGSGSTEISVSVQAQPKFRYRFRLNRNFGISVSVWIRVSVDHYF